jgi:hypothetical protein
MGNFLVVEMALSAYGRQNLAVEILEQSGVFYISGYVENEITSFNRRSHAPHGDHVVAFEGHVDGFRFWCFERMNSSAGCPANI